MAAERLLVVDDDADTRANLEDILSLDGFEVVSAGTLAEALGRDDLPQFAAIVLDRMLPDGTAEAVLPRLRRLAPEAALIIVTGYSDIEGAITAVRQGAADYMLKPVNPDLIRSRLAGVVERRRAVQEIARLNADLRLRLTELQTLLDVVPIGIAISHDSAGEQIQVNPAFARLLRLPPGANASVTAPEAERPPYQLRRNGRVLTGEELPMQLAASRGVEVRNAELDLVHPDGAVVNLYGSAAPLFDERGRPCGSVGAFVDITERKRAQERLLQTERLAAIGQMITGLAHESGNALARSRACLEMLSWEVEDRPEAQELIASIQKAQDHLQQLYGEVRDYAAPIKLEREAWDLASVWRQAWDNLELVRRGRDAGLCEEPGGPERVVPADLLRLGQVFRNILENSLAACPDPVRITIRCAEACLNGRPAVCVSVRDNGPGFSPEQRERLFEPFYTTKTKGTGLGMAIAKRIVDAHGGQIALGPASAGGAEIIVTLPREAP
jgi:signal transduction histidine kinase